MDWEKVMQQWDAFEHLDAHLRVELDNLSQEELEDAFGAQLSFGTAGMRGVLGVGPNRMNKYTVRQATQGLAELIKSEGEEAMARGVAIGYDSRHYSPEFALESALVLAKNGIKSYLFRDLRPTPAVSFAVRHWEAYAGIMITASHNPKEYNGYKVYGEDGGQMPPEDSDRLTEFVRAVENPLAVEVADEVEARDSGILQIIKRETDDAYFEELATVTIDRDLIQEMNDDVHIVFTPLHGTGKYYGEKGLSNAGFTNVHLVKAQSTIDGDFPTVESPNPESEEVFTQAEELGRQVDADILLATDPDADRLGAKAKDASGNHQLLTGNQIACVMLDYILQAKSDKGELPSNGVACKSIVSTNLADRIIESYGLDMVEVLTGFRFIAEKIEEYEQSGDHTFLMGFEESYGYLVKPFVRDKDAIQALVVLAELVAYHKKHGRTLVDALEGLYEKHGYFLEKTISVRYPGLAGAQQMKDIMARIRREGISDFAGIQVVETADYLVGERTDANGQVEALSEPSSDALKYKLEDGSWVAFRPSGTEPLIKMYLGVVADIRQAVEEKAEKVEAAVRQAAQ